MKHILSFNLVLVMSLAAIAAEPKRDAKAVEG
jgi:hypothetical protein